MFFAQILLTSLVTGTQVLLLAAGLYLIYTVTRVFHIALGATMIAAAYGFYAVSHGGGGFWGAFGVGLLVAAMLGVVSFYILRPYINKSQVLLALLVSIALGTAIESIIAIGFGSEGKFLIESVLPTIEFLGLRITQVGFWTLIVGLITAVTAYIFLYLLPYGRVVRAVAQHRECASLLGIKEKRVRLYVFIFTGILAGVIGILTGMNSAITPLSGFHPLILAFIALLVGGVADFKGTIVASYLLVLVPELIIANSYGGVSFSASWKMVFVFIIALASLSIKPNGLFTKVIRKT